MAQDQLRTLALSVFDPLEDFAQLLAGKVTGELGRSAREATAIIEKAEGSVLAAITPDHDNSADLLARIDAKVRGSLAQQFRETEAQLGRVDQRTTAEIQELLAGTRGRLEAWQQQVQDQLAQENEDQRGLLQNLTGAVSSLGSVLLGSASSTADIITGKVAALGSELAVAFAFLGEEVGTRVSGAADALGDKIKGGLEAVLGGFFGDMSGDVVERIDGILQVIETDPDVPPELKQLTAPGLLPLGVIGGFVAGLAIPMIIGNLASTAMQPYMLKIQQNILARIRPSLLPLADLSRGLHGDMMDPTRAHESAARQGFTDEDWVDFLEITKLRPGTQDLISLWLREEINESVLDTELHRLGWDATWRQVFRSAAFAPPPVQDLIRMAVREVFTPDVAERFGVFENVPDGFIKWGKQVGLSPEWVKNYWGAHWELPSLQEGFRMLHRTTDEPVMDGSEEVVLPSGKKVYRVIGSELTRLLMRTQDVMPFWQQGLMETQFSTFTRVDIRRMHKLGVLDEDGVFRAHIDIGYDQDKAAALTRFVLELNREEVKVEKEKDRDLTKGDILGLFEDGLLEPSDALSGLMSLGFSRDEGELLIAREELHQLRQDRLADIDSIIRSSKRGELGFEQAQDRLRAMDLAPREFTKAVAKLARDRVDKERQPSKGDLDQWFEMDLLDLVTYGNELSNLGYSERFVTLYQAEATTRKGEDLEVEQARAFRARQPRLETKGDLDRLFRSGVIEETEYRTGLLALRFTQAAINRQVELHSVEAAKRAERQAEALEKGEEPEEDPRLPTRTELDRFAKSELITEEAYREGLTRRAFTQQSIDLFVQILKQKGVWRA